MNDTEFNLLDEPWIRVMDPDDNIYEVSLTEAIIGAHRYRALCGELSTQDIAVLRLLLAVLHTVFSRVDADGVEIDISDKNDAFELWRSLWKHGRFPEKPVCDYLKKWHERFWLFHPERPFGQVAKMTVGTTYDAKKLNGEISESGHKIRLFSSYSGNSKNTLTYPQAARWLLHLNAFDDASAKPQEKGLPSPGVGWLGKIGPIYLVGNNLFETLMMNMVMVNGDNAESDEHPVWEKDTVARGERIEIKQPDDLAALYTLQSRRIELNRNDDGEVVGYTLLAGEFFSEKNAFIEPMTAWNKPKDRSDDYTPKRHDPSKQMWREFSSFYGAGDVNDDRQIAGVVKWYRNYVRKVVGKKAVMRTRIVSIQYDGNNASTKQIFSDELSIHASLLSDIGANYRDDIQKEIEKCQNNSKNGNSLAKEIGLLAQELYIAAGGTQGDPKSPDKGYDSAGRDAKAQLFYRLDMSFRKWLSEIDPEGSTEKADMLEKWQEIAVKTARNYANELVMQSGEQAMTGHAVKDAKTEKVKLYSAPHAYKSFNIGLNIIYKKK